MMLFPLGIVVALPVLVLGITALLYWPWNTTIPDIFGLRPITFWQALRLLIIALILFGSGGSLIRIGG